MKYFIFFTIISALLVSFAAVGKAENNDIGVILKTSSTGHGSEVEVKVTAFSQLPVNAFDIIVEYSPEHLEFTRASTVNSVVSVWQSLPLEKRNGSLRLTGGMIQPFSGKEGEIITLAFRAKISGLTEVVLKRADFFLADGKGTLVETLPNSARFAITKFDANLLAGPEAPAPRISEVTVARDPLAKTPIVLVKTEDDGAVREMQMRSREWLLWSEWQKTRLTASVPKHAWAIQLAAIGWSGSMAETATIYRWDVIGLKLLIIFAALAMLGYAIKRIFRIWKIKKRRT